MEYYKLCYVEGNKAWFTNNFEKQWGDDWNDKPYKIKYKVLYFETGDWTEKRPCDGFLNSPYSVEDINKQAVAWIHTDKFNILAGTTYENFIDIIERHGGKVYVLKENDENE